MSNYENRGFYFTSVIVRRLLTSIPNIISLSSSMYFLTVSFPISEFSDNVTTSSALIFSPLYTYPGVSSVRVVTVVQLLYFHPTRMYYYLYIMAI